MRLLLLFPLAFVPLFAQIAPSPRPAKSLIRRGPVSAAKPAPKFPTPAPVAPHVCSIPLVNVVGVETHDKMIAPALPATGKDVAIAPAPPCGSK
jgi:hypothetical protein